MVAGHVVKCNRFPEKASSTLGSAITGKAAVCKPDVRVQRASVTSVCQLNQARFFCRPHVSDASTAHVERAMRGCQRSIRQNSLIRGLQKL